MKRICVALCLTISCLFIFNFQACKSTSQTAVYYKISVSLNDNLLNGKEVVCFENQTDNTFTSLKFNLFGNAFRKDAKFKPISTQYENRAYYKGESYGQMQVLSVKQGEKTLPFAIVGQDQNILEVSLEQELFPNEKVQIEIEFSLTLAFVIARTGINQSTINLANFYPILCGIDENGFYESVYYSNGDPFFSDVADYSVEIELDGEFVVASSGNLVGEKSLNGKSIKSYIQESARSFCFVLSKKFKSIKKTVGQTEITYYYFEDETAETSLKYACQSLELFNALFGEYPYKTYSVVQTEFMQGGMEHPALVMISNQLEPSAYREVIVHETAHQWWQTVVGNNEIEYGFLDEGLTEYSVVLFYENYKEYGLTRENLISSTERTYKVFCSVSDKLFGKVNTVMLRSLKDFSSEYEYVNMAYIKPCIMYDTLRKTVGEEKFFKGLNRYYESYKFKNATPDDLVGVYEKTGADSNGFFKSFFNGTVII